MRAKWIGKLEVRGGRMGRTPPSPLVGNTDYVYLIIYMYLYVQ